MRTRLVVGKVNKVETEHSIRLNDIKESYMDRLNTLSYKIQQQLLGMDYEIAKADRNNKELINYYSYIASTNIGESRLKAIEWLAYNS